MLVDMTYPDLNKDKKINDMVGKPYSFIQRFKMGGIGSGRLMIKSASLNISKILARENSTKYTNIELRSNGIIVGFKVYQNIYHWVIPFYRLNIYKSGDYLAIYDNEEHVKVYLSENQRLSKFYKKLLEIKAELQESQHPVDSKSDIQ